MNRLTDDLAGRQLQTESPNSKGFVKHKGKHMEKGTKYTHGVEVTMM